MNQLILDYIQDFDALASKARRVDCFLLRNIVSNSKSRTMYLSIPLVSDLGLYRGLPLVRWLEDGFLRCCVIQKL